MDDTEIKNKIYEYLKEGMHRKDAANMAGISEATFYRWLESDESFKSRIEANILEYKRSLIHCVNTCAIKDGRLALEVLKRRFPKEWSENSGIEENNDLREGMDKLAEALDAIVLANEVGDDELLKR